jgi:hypothetical protein
MLILFTESLEMNLCCLSLAVFLPQVPAGSHRHGTAV